MPAPACSADRELPWHPQRRAAVTETVGEYRAAVVQLILDGRSFNAAQILPGYAEGIIDSYNAELAPPRAGAPSASTVVARVWFNSNLEALWSTVSRPAAILVALEGPGDHRAVGGPRAGAGRLRATAGVALEPGGDHRRQDGVGLPDRPGEGTLIRNGTTSARMPATSPIGQASDHGKGDKDRRGEAEHYLVTEKRVVESDECHGMRY